MRKVFLVSLVMLLSGCGVIGQSDYERHAQARVEFKQSDDSRIKTQTTAIIGLASKPSASAEAEAYKNALATLSISMLKNQEYGERAPMTAIEGAVEVAKQVIPIGVNAISNTAIAREGIRSAGNVDIGQGATVTNSLNKPNATSVGSGAVATVQPYEVRPEVVEQQIVP